jgi:translation elongation factor EF-Tu-like GTPase
VATEFDADLRLLPTAEGGRETALRSGYRSTVRFGGADGEMWGVEITLGERTELAPGESALVSMTAWADPPPPSVGTAIRLYEGARLVGAGAVRE